MHISLVIKICRSAIRSLLKEFKDPWLTSSCPKESLTNPFIWKLSMLAIRLQGHHKCTSWVFLTSRHSADSIDINILALKLVFPQNYALFVISGLFLLNLILLLKMICLAVGVIFQNKKTQEINYFIRWNNPARTLKLEIWVIWVPFTFRFQF